MPFETGELEKVRAAFTSLVVAPEVHDTLYILLTVEQESVEIVISEGTEKCITEPEAIGQFT